MSNANYLSNPSVRLQPQGGSIIWMMEHFLTLEVFNLGIQNYLKERAYNNANAEHLWHELTYVCIISVKVIWVVKNMVAFLIVKQRVLEQRCHHHAFFVKAFESYII